MGAWGLAWCLQAQGQQRDGKPAQDLGHRAGARRKAVSRRGQLWLLLLQLLQAAGSAQSCVCYPPGQTCHWPLWGNWLLPLGCRMYPWTHKCLSLMDLPKSWIGTVWVVSTMTVSPGTRTSPNTEAPAGTYQHQCQSRSDQHHKEGCRTLHPVLEQQHVREFTGYWFQSMSTSTAFPMRPARITRPRASS